MTPTLTPDRRDVDVALPAAPAANPAPALGVWWLHPSLLFSATAAATLIPALLMSQRTYARYGTPKYLDADSLMLGILACLAVACGVFIGARMGPAPRPISNAFRQMLLICFLVAAGLTLFGYSVWVANGVRNGFRPQQVAEFAGGDDQEWAELKFEVFQTVPGVTTCTQFGLLAVILGCLLRRRDSRWLVPLLAAIVFLALIRMFAVSERLALVELVVLMGLTVLRTRVLNRPRTPGLQLALALAPVVAIVLLVLLFGTAEYFRSWRYYRNEGGETLAEFTLSRFAGYYSTGHNNGAMVWNTHGTLPLPYHTLEWLWRFPMWDKTPLSYEKIAGVDFAVLRDSLLNRWANSEFNNPGGLFCPTLDYGVLGGALFWLGFGFVAGRLYVGYLAGALAGLLLYPFAVMTILEMPRFLYVCNTRPFPALVMIAVVLVLCADRGGHRDSH